MIRSVIFVFILLIPSTLVAADAWVTLFGGYNSYDMTDVNRDIEILNNEIAPLKMDEIDGGSAAKIGDVMFACKEPDSGESGRWMQPRR